MRRPTDVGVAYHACVSRRRHRPSTTNAQGSKTTSSLLPAHPADGERGA